MLKWRLKKMQNVSTSPLSQLVLQNNPNAPKQAQYMPIYSNGANVVSPAPEYQLNDTYSQSTPTQKSVRMINPLLMLSTFGVLLFSLVSASNVSKATKSIGELSTQFEALIQKLQGNLGNNVAAGEIDKLQKAVSSLSTEIQNSKIANTEELGKLTNIIDGLKQIVQKTASSKPASNADMIVSQVTNAINANSKFAQEEMSSHAVFLSDKLTSLLVQLQESIAKISQMAENNPSAKTSLYQEAAQVLEETSNLMTQNATKTQEKITQASGEALEKLKSAFAEQVSKLESRIQSLDAATEKLSTSQGTFAEQSNRVVQKMGDMEARIQASVNKLGELSPQKAIQEIQEYSRQAIIEISQNANSISKEAYEQSFKQINVTANAAISLIAKSASDVSQNSQLLIQDELIKSIAQIQKIMQDAQKASLQTQDVLQGAQKTATQIQGILQNVQNKEPQPLVNIQDAVKSKIYFSKDTIGLAFDKSTNEKFNGTILGTITTANKPVAITFKDGLIQQSVIGDEKSGDFLKKVYTRIVSPKNTIKEILKVEISDSSPVVKIMSSSTLNCPKQSPAKAVSLFIKDTSSKIKNEIIKLIRKGDEITLIDGSKAPQEPRVVKIKEGKKLPIETGNVRIIKKTSPEGYICNLLDCNI